MPSSENRWLTHLQKNIVIGLLVALLLVVVTYYKVEQYRTKQFQVKVSRAIQAYAQAPKRTYEQKQAALHNLKNNLNSVGHPLIAAQTSRASSLLDPSIAGALMNIMYECENKRVILEQARTTYENVADVDPQNSNIAEIALNNIGRAEDDYAQSGCFYFVE